MSTCSRCGFKPKASVVTVGAPLHWNIDVLDVIRSGQTPPSAVVDCIPDRVAILEARHQTMQDDLACLEGLILQKRQEIASTRAEIERTKSLSAPIRSIPHEILLRIFSLVDVPYFCALHPRQPPCSFGHVCRFWRTLSRSAPSLWARMTVEHPGEAGFANVFEQHLVLSSSRPLHIDLSLGIGSNSNSNEAVKAVMNALATHSIRLQDLKFSGGTFETECFFDMLSEADLRLLRCLEVQPFSLLPDLQVYNIAFHASLRSLEMNLPFSAFKSVRGQWQHLTSFMGTFPGAASFYRFLVAAENLARLTISCIGNDKDSRARPMIIHENINHLTLGQSCSMSIALDNISLPHLGTLILELDSGHHGLTCPAERRPSYHAVLCRLLDRSQCALKSFTFSSVYYEPEALAYIRGMSTIMCLRFHFNLELYPSMSEVSTVLDSLTITSSQQPLPRLRELELAIDMDDDCLFNNSKLYDLVASRWNVTGNVSRLSKLTLESYARSNEPHTAYETSTLAAFLLNLKDQGLDVAWRIVGRQNVLEDAKKGVESYL